MTYTVTQKIRPNNETRLTLTKKRGVFLSLKERAAICLGVSTSEVVELVRNVPTLSSTLTFVENSEPDAKAIYSHSHKRTKFGKSAITRIYDAAGALDRYDAERSNYLFLTATLPGNTDEAKYGIAEYAHEIIDGLKSWLSKRMQNRLEFYVWENQKRGALHFHYCIYVPDEKIQENIAAEFKAEMVRLYDRIGQKHGCNLWGRYSSQSFAQKTDVLQARVEIVYGSVGAYMAGYLAGKGDKHSGDNNHRYYPKRWFGVSRPLSDLVKSYTEEVKHEFDSLREANEFFYQTKEYLLDDVLTYGEFKHKVGEGKTAYFFHTQEKQLELWQPKPMLTHTPQNHPNISSYASLTLRNIQLLRVVLASSKSLRGSLPLKFVMYFQDATLMTSLKSGALSQKTIQMLEGVFCAYDFSLSSEYKIRALFHNLKLYTLITSKYHPEMRFNRQGFLENNADFSRSVDELFKACYVRTNTDEVDAPNEADGSRAHVACEPASPSYEQLEI